VGDDQRAPGSFEALCKEFLVKANPEKDQAWIDKHAAAALAEVVETLDEKHPLSKTARRRKQQGAASSRIRKAGQAAPALTGGIRVTGQRRERPAELRRRYEAGEGVEELAESTGLSRGQVSRDLRRAGVKPSQIRPKQP
jgi:hypothetical protein